MGTYLLMRGPVSFLLDKGSPFSVTRKLLSFTDFDSTPQFEAPALTDMEFIFLPWNFLYFFFSIVNLYAFFEGFAVILCSNSLMRQVTHREYVKNAKSQIRWEINIHSIVAFFFLSVGAVNARVLDLLVFGFILIWFQMLKIFFVRFF